MVNLKILINPGFVFEARYLHYNYLCFRKWKVFFMENEMFLGTLIVVEIKLCNNCDISVKYFKNSC
jgi:hypothetical protein